MHPTLALKFAAWCSPRLDLQILRFHRELILTGSASLGKPKTEEELKQAFEVATAEIPDEMQRYKHTHEGQFKKFLDDNGELYTFNRISADDPSVCGKYRPDFLFQLPAHYIIIEVDEHQHADADPHCEVIRMLNIAHGCGLHVVFLRFNPDGDCDKEAVLHRLRYFKKIDDATLASMPILTVEYFGYSEDRVSILKKIQQEDILVDPTSMIRSLKSTCEKKEETISLMKNEMDQLRSALKEKQVRLAANISGQKPRFSIENYQAMAESKGYTYILDTLPKNTCTKVAGWQCPQGHVADISYSNFKSRKHCPQCRGTHKKTVKDYIDLAKSRGGEYILDNIPFHANDVAEDAWRCSEGHVWPASFTKISSANSWCPTCSKIRERHTMEDYVKMGNRFDLKFVSACPPINANEPYQWSCINHPDEKISISYHRLGRKTKTPCAHC
jgi:hypothetical protein